VVAEGFGFYGFDKDDALPSYNVGWQMLHEFVEDGKAEQCQPMEEMISSAHLGP